MPRVNSKKKGNRGELAICKILSDHFQQKFNRVPASGAISTIHQLQQNSARTLAGDIICPDNFNFSIENKYGYDIDLYSLFQKDNGDKRKFIDFIEQAKEDANKVVGISPMVIYTRTRKKPLVGFSKFNLDNVLLDALDQFFTLKIEKIKDLNGLSGKNTDIWIFADLQEVLEKFPIEFFFSKNKEKKDGN